MGQMCSVYVFVYELKIKTIYSKVVGELVCRKGGGSCVVHSYGNYIRRFLIV